MEGVEDGEITSTFGLAGSSPLHHPEGCVMKSGRYWQGVYVTWECWSLMVQLQVVIV